LKVIGIVLVQNYHKKGIPLRQPVRKKLKKHKFIQLPCAKPLKLIWLFKTRRLPLCSRNAN
jgi:hypothetical protein